jgi:hypothetical protein
MTNSHISTTINIQAIITYSYHPSLDNSYRADIEFRVNSDTGGLIPYNAQSPDRLMGEILASNWGDPSDGYRSRVARLYTTDGWPVLDKMATYRAVAIIEQLRQIVASNREAVSLTPKERTISTFI